MANAVAEQQCLRIGRTATSDFGAFVTCSFHSTTGTVVEGPYVTMEETTLSGGEEEETV